MEEYKGTLKPTSSKKTFHQNVKECRDVIVKKVSEQGRVAVVTHHTHFGPIPPYKSLKRYEVQRVCPVFL